MSKVLGNSVCASLVALAMPALAHPGTDAAETPVPALMSATPRMVSSVPPGEPVRLLARRGRGADDAAGHRRRGRGSDDHPGDDHGRRKGGGHGRGGHDDGLNHT